MKYIDADKLIAKLRKHLMPTVLDRNYDEWEHGKDAGFHQAISIAESLQQENEIIELSFKGGTYKVNGEEKSFKGGKAKVIILEINQEEE